MRLSEYPADKGADILLSVIPLIGEITADEEYAGIIAKMRETGGGKKGTRRTGFDPNELIAFLLSRHRTATWSLLAALNEKSAEEIRSQTFGEASQQIGSMLHDPEILGFFMPLGLLGPETP